MKENADMSIESVDDCRKIEALTSALQKTKDELIHWTLMSDEDGDTAIHLAIIRRDIHLCTYLCRLLDANNIDFNIQNKLMQTPLHLACITENSKLVENLLELKQIKIEDGDRHGNTCLHLATKHDDILCDSMRIILNHNIAQKNNSINLLDVKNIYGHSALHIAATINKPEAISLLLAHGADIDPQETKSGKSPLYLAVQERNTEAVQQLLEHGADVNKLTYFRDSPSQLASSQDRRSLLRLISRYDPSSKPESPPLHRHKVCGMVNRLDDTGFGNNNEIVQKDTRMSEHKGLNPGSEKHRRNVIVKNSPHKVTTTLPATPQVKSERISPVANSSLPYETTRTSLSGKAGNMLNTFDAISRPLSSIYGIPRQVVNKTVQKPFVPHHVAVMSSERLKRLDAVSRTREVGDSRRCVTTFSDIEKNDLFPEAFCMTKPQNVRESLCVTDESLAKTSVSKRKTVATKTTSEPLDLSQNREVSSLETGQCQANMLLDVKMNVESEGVESTSNIARETILQEIKKEALDDETVSVETTVQPSIPVPTYPAFAYSKFRSDQAQREPLVSCVNPWLPFPSTMINPHAFLPPAAYGIITAALGARTPMYPFATVDAVTAHQNSVPLGFPPSWVNLSLDVARAVDRLREEPSSPDNQSSRKRKASEDNTHQHETENITEQLKRFRRQESSAEGLHRSVSDDPGKGREHDKELISKRTLRRRNSAPSSGELSQVLKNDQQRKIHPVDLHSYAGCLPPHCLHLLQSSGNLALPYRDHPLRSVAEDARNITVQRHESGIYPQDLKATGMHMNDVNIPANASQTLRPHKLDFRSIGHPQSQALTLTSTSTYYKELCRSEARESEKTNGVSPFPLPFSRTKKFSGNRSYRKNRSSIERCRNRSRKASETESDDDDYIQSLQISDASGDEDDEYDDSLNNSNATSLSIQQNTKNTLNAIEFGKGSWKDLDLGNLPAFGGTIAVPSTTQTSGTISASNVGTFPSAPTKMACSVARSYPQLLNGIPSIYRSSNFFQTKTKLSENENSYASEFLPHDVITESRQKLKTDDLALIQKQSVMASQSHKCKGCIGASSQNENRLKLIGRIFQHSSRVTSSSGCQNTSPHCVPRLVFTSEVKLPSEIQLRKQLHAHTENTIATEILTQRSEKESGSYTKDVNKRDCQEYSHKLFKCSRAAKEAKTSTNSTNHGAEKENIKKRDQSVVVRGHSILPHSTVLASRTRRHSSSSSARLNSLDAKLEELRQKATEREEMANRQDKRVNEMKDQDPHKTKVNDVTQSLASSDTEKIQSPSTTTYDQNRQPNSSPFQESTRFGGKRNVAVIKPNRSQIESRHSPEHVCPPKKRHMKRYSPDFYYKPRKEILREREVRSASPMLPEPIVSTSVQINNDERSLNVRWCSPDRSPSRKKQHNHSSSARTILTYRVPLKPLRGGNSHTVKLEQNYRKYPRYVSSPRLESDAVIVVESRLEEGAIDEIEIGDLEISDDEY